MAIYDVSQPIDEAMAVWPGDPQPTLVLLSDRELGAVANVRHLALSTHTGTHVDAPDHFVRGGKTVDQIDLERMIGPCQVMAVECGAHIELDDLKRIWPTDHAPVRVLFKTANSQRQLLQSPEFHTDFVALSAPAAEFLVSAGVLTVGIDYYSIEPFENPGYPTHMTLLSHDVMVIEGVNLTKVEPGRYRLACLPLRLIGADGSPARVLLEDLA